MAKKSGSGEGNDEEEMRVRTPKDDEVLGILVERHGGSRSSVRCLDGHTRMCRIPGSLRRKLWVREGDLVLVEPWEFEDKEKGDIVHKYSDSQVEWLKKKGFLKKLDEFKKF